MTASGIQERISVWQWGVSASSWDQLAAGQAMFGKDEKKQNGVVKSKALDVATGRQSPCDIIYFYMDLAW